VEIKKKKELEAALKELSKNIKGDRYSDALFSTPLPDNSSAWKELVDVKALKKALVDQKAEQERLKELLAAIENREHLAGERAKLQQESDAAAGGAGPLGAPAEGTGGRATVEEAAVRAGEGEGSGRSGSASRHGRSSTSSP
jgi:hypothetical protein